MRLMVLQLLVLFIPGLAGAVNAGDASRDEGEFRTLYKELVEINTTRSTGSCTRAAQAMRAHAEGSRAHGLNERIRVRSLLEGRRFLYEVVKLYAGSG